MKLMKTGKFQLRVFGDEGGQFWESGFFFTVVSQSSSFSTLTAGTASRKEQFAIQSEQLWGADKDALLFFLGFFFLPANFLYIFHKAMPTATAIMVYVMISCNISGK